MVARLDSHADEADARTDYPVVELGGGDEEDRERKADGRCPYDHDDQQGDQAEKVGHELRQRVGRAPVEQGHRDVAIPDEGGCVPGGRLAV